MTGRRRMRFGFLVTMTALVAVSTAAAIERAAAGSPAQTNSGPARVMPRYNNDGALVLPDDYRRWVFVGSSLGLSYSEGQPGMEMFHETLMEPTAYDYFVKTGTFREGTMLALMLHGTGEKVLPARRGKFATDVHGVELAVKDSAHRAEGWAYYNFGGMNALRTTARALPKESCYSCHAEHARRDNVFLQFYQLLAEAARIPLSAGPAASNGQTGVAPPDAASPRAESGSGAILALKGLDPVLLTAGREEPGKAEIVMSRAGYRYQFVSEPNRARFAADPDAFSIQNQTCLVVRGAEIDPDLFAVHDRRIYAFATSDCVSAFKRQPEAFLKGQRD